MHAHKKIYTHIQTLTVTPVCSHTHTHTHTLKNAGTHIYAHNHTHTDGRIHPRTATEFSLGIKALLWL